MILNIKTGALVCAALTLLSFGIASTARATDDQDNTNPNGWVYVVKQTIGQINSYAAANSLRVTDLNAHVLRGKNNTEFDAVLVPNTGSYQATWTLQQGLTTSEVFSYGQNNDYIPAHIAPYYTTSGTIGLFFAVVYVANPGNAVGWDFYTTNNGATTISDVVDGGVGRMVEFKSAGPASNHYYAGFGVLADSRTSKYYYNSSIATIQAGLTSGFRVVSLIPGLSGTYTAILDNEVNFDYYYYGATETQVYSIGTLGQARPISLAPEAETNSTSHFDVAYTAN